MTEPLPDSDHEPDTVAAVAPGRAPLPIDAATLPELDATYADTLRDGLVALGLMLDDGVSRAIDAHARLLLAWNEHINLTAIRTPEAVARLHVLDSLSAVSVLRGRVSEATAILDLGSGCGYPGIPLALALPAARLTLVDSVAKKARFLQVAADAVTAARKGASDRLAVDVQATRAEQLAADERRESWDVVTVRAVGTLAEVAELGMPLLRRGGLLLCWKRVGGSTGTDPGAPPGLDHELRHARALITDLGGDTPEVVAVESAGLQGHRLVLVHKMRPTPRRFPRLLAERRHRLLR
ncbi:MAG: 16S rRNA (guanine(527)-N(7))-methyltransferase RsmG [Chloroflexi bacterium]|nr:16S rRNA (guanine(527)-N(7))-methyltransferase RsmG [Chloroflexota bacterium]